MTLTIAIFLSIAITTTILCALYVRKVLYFLIPLWFVGCFAITYQTVNYLGFPVEHKFVADGTEGVIVHFVQNGDTITVLFWMPEVKNYRLVEFPLTDENSESMGKALEPNSVMRFGKAEGKQGNGQDQGGEPSDFEIVPFGESKIGGKE
jgi:hypothetical protein